MLNSYDKFAVTQNLYPKAVVKELSKDYEFMESIGIDSSMHIALPGHDTSFEKQSLFVAIQKLQISTKVSLIDRNGNEWAIRISLENNDILEIEFEERTIAIEGFTIPALSQEKRASLISQLCNFNLFTTEDTQTWLNQLSDENMSPDFTFEFYEKLKASTPSILQRIKAEIASGKGRLTELVPKSDGYYEGLIGKYEASNDISEFSDQEAQKHVRQLIEANRFEVLAPYIQHTSLAALVSKLVSEEHLPIIFQSANLANPMHLTGLAELSFFANRSAVDTGEILERFFECRLNVFDVLSSTFILVYADMGANRVLNGKPAFYRRLAALTHASLLFDIFNELKIDLVDFHEAAKKHWGPQFIFQILFELDTDPRWFPDYISGDKMKQGFIGRIGNGAQGYPLELKEKLKKYFDPEEEDSIPNQRSMESFLPSPVEGNITANKIDQNLDSTLKARLNKEDFEISSVAPIINLAAYFKIDDNDIAEVVQKLRDSQRKISSTTAQSEIHFVLSGLSRLACITKSKDLAQEFRVVFRVYRSYLELETNLAEILIYGVIAAASMEIQTERAEFIGSWASELAYLKFEPEQLSTLHSWLYEMCKVDPRLFHYCGKSLAALEQFTR